MSTEVADPNVVDAVLEAENARITAINQADWDTASQFLGEDLTYTHMNGLMQNKAENIEGTRARPRTYRRSDLSVRVIGEVAVMNGMIDVDMHPSADRTAERLHGRVVQVWAYRDGRWQMIVFQATAVPTD